MALQQAWRGSSSLRAGLAPAGAVGLSRLLEEMQEALQTAWMATGAAAYTSSSRPAAATQGASGADHTSAAHSQSQQLQQQYLYQQPPGGGVGQAGGTQQQQRQPLLPRFVTEALPQPLPVLEALQLVQQRARAKFPETVEAHVRLRVDPRRGDQMVRGAAVVPFSLGKPIRIAVFAEGADADEARQAGADVVGSDDLAAGILASKGKSVDFTACIATPDMMPRLVKLGRILGPKGLMPNPKMGTLTTNVAAAVAELRRGRIEFKMDRTGIVHAAVGKASFPTHQLYANVGALAAALLAAKPEAVKGGLIRFVRGVTLCSTMGRGVPVDVASLQGAIEAAAAELAAAGGGASPS